MAVQAGKEGRKEDSDVSVSNNFASGNPGEGPPMDLGPTGRSRWFLSSRGLRLASYFYPSPRPKAVIFLAHGHGSYFGYDYLKGTVAGSPPVYESSWVQRLNNDGYSVCGYDAQGCGRSEGTRCFFRSFDDVVDDAVAFLKLSRSSGLHGFEADLPLFALGCSMGGCVVIHAAMKLDPCLAGVVLLAPMITLERVSKQGLNPYLKHVASLLSYLTPELQVASAAKNVRFPDLQEAWEKDPWTYTAKTRARVATEYLRATTQLCQRLTDVRFPFLCFHSEEDTMCDVDGSKRLYLQAQSEDKELRLVNEHWHILVKEPHNEAIREQIVKWADARCTPAPGLATQ